MKPQFDCVQAECGCTVMVVDRGYSHLSVVVETSVTCSNLPESNQHIETVAMEACGTHDCMVYSRDN